MTSIRKIRKRVKPKARWVRHSVVRRILKHLRQLQGTLFKNPL